MKPEVKDIAVQLAASSPTSLYAIFSQITLAEWIAIILGILQALYLIRKWWREESEWGIKIKRWAESRRLTSSKPMELDE